MNVVNDVSASIFSSGRWFGGHLVSDLGRVHSIEGRLLRDGPTPPYLIPAFVDLHVHGGGGYDIMQAGDAIVGTARFHAAHGTGAFCPTTLTAPAEQITTAVRDVGTAMREATRGGAEILGVHLEGPFINPHKLGGQPPFAIPPDVALARQWLELARVKVVTLAPELPGADELIGLFASHDTRVQIGHSLATAETVADAFRWGAVGFAHLYNAAGALSARSPGVIGYALDKARWAELICDLKHVHPDLLRTAIRLIEKAYFVTDCCSAAGLDDGHYHLGLNPVTKRMGAVYLRDTEQLAASVLTADQAFRNIVSLGVGLETAVWMTSTRPAEFASAHGYGDLVLGKYASCILLDEGMNIIDVWLKGERLDR